ncbi:MAG: hypothetical protein D6726_11850, partial [Nitrospirae bacterium]
MRKGILILMILVLSGCAGILNPYDSDFSCPATYEGRCVSIQEAYETSLDPNFEEPVPNDYLYEYNSEKVKRKGKKKTKSGVLRLEEKEAGVTHTETNSYTETLYSEIKGLLAEPKTPIVKPPKIMRILVLAYPEGESRL